MAMQYVWLALCSIPDRRTKKGSTTAASVGSHLRDTPNSFRTRPERTTPVTACTPTVRRSTGSHTRARQFVRPSLAARQEWLPTSISTSAVCRKPGMKCCGSQTRLPMKEVAEVRYTSVERLFGSMVGQGDGTWKRI